MHIFHKWETVSKHETKIALNLTINGIKYTANHIPAVVEIQKCKVCPKERAFVYYNHNKVSVNPDLWKIKS